MPPASYGYDTYRRSASAADEYSYDQGYDVSLDTPTNGPTLEHETASYISEKQSVDSSWKCIPFKQQLLQMEVDNALLNNTDHNNIISKLCDMGIKVYLLMYDSSDLKKDLEQIVEDASHDDWTTCDFNRCCLFKDDNGRVFNTILSGGASGLASTWASNKATFSGLHATLAMTVLSRSLACIPGSENLGLGPIYLALIAGSILYSETSHSWLSAQIYVNGTPSTSSVALTSILISDCEF